MPRKSVEGLLGNWQRGESKLFSLKLDFDIISQEPSHKSRLGNLEEVKMVCLHRFEQDVGKPQELVQYSRDQASRRPNHSEGTK